MYTTINTYYSFSDDCMFSWLDCSNPTRTTDDFVLLLESKHKVMYSIKTRIVVCFVIGRSRSYVILSLRFRGLS